MNPPIRKNLITMEEIEAACLDLSRKIIHHEDSGVGHYKVFGIPRGGLLPAALVVKHLAQLGATARQVYTPSAATVIVDDIIDSGSTAQRYEGLAPVYACFSRRPEHVGQGRAYAVADGWLVFPWEAISASDTAASAEDIVVRLLQYIGEDPHRGGLLETPERVVKAWSEWFSGYEEAPADVLKTFDDGAEKVNEMVVVRDIPVYSHCEHHLAPFFGVAHIAYIPKGKIVGLSKLSRVVDVLARRLQVQERLTNQVADAVYDCLEATGAGVILECRHMCMESRGINRAGVTTMTSALRGNIFEQPAARSEFFSLAMPKR